MKLLQFLFLFCLVFSCVENASSPKGVLSNFVKERFKGKSFSEVKGYLSENFQNQVTELEDTKYNKLENIKKKKFKILSENCNPSDCNITYFVSYTTVDKGNKDFETETKKIAKLVKVGETWLIDKIDHIKTYHDMVKEIQVEGEK